MINKSKNNKIVTYRKEKKLLFLIFYKQDMYSPLPDTKFAVETFEYNFKLWTNAISSTARSCRISLGPPILSHPYVGFGRLEIRDRSSTASGRNHTQKQGDTPKRKQNHRLSLLDTGRHEFWRSVRHTVRNSHITGTRAVSGVWL